MFTGLVSDIGVVERIVPRQGGVRLTVRPSKLPVDALVHGESVACCGACLTVIERGGGLVSFDAIPETLSRTTLGGWRPGTRINLERALALGERLGGHLVQGHVDAVGEVLAKVVEGQGARLTVSLPASIAPLVAEKGSIAVDGISLTVVDCGSDWFTVALIPETVKHTALRGMRPGDSVNLEADPIGRFVARALTLRGSDEKLARFAQGGWGV